MFAAHIYEQSQSFYEHIVILTKVSVTIPYLVISVFLFWKNFTELKITICMSRC